MEAIKDIKGDREEKQGLITWSDPIPFSDGNNMGKSYAGTYKGILVAAFVCDLKQEVFNIMIFPFLTMDNRPMPIKANGVQEVKENIERKLEALIIVVQGITEWNQK